MRVWAGSVILEPGLQESDFAELARQGVWLAKAGFGAFPTPYEYAPQVAWAKSGRHGDNGAHRRLVNPRFVGDLGGPSVKIDPHVSYHVNGGPVAMPDADYPRLINESNMALQICTAGNLRTALLVTDLVKKKGDLDRLLIATDTPTGSGVMPLGMTYTMTHLVSLGGLAPEQAIAAATGNNARVYRLNSGFSTLAKMPTSY